MWKYLFFAMSALLNSVLVGCTASESDIQTAIAQTEEAKPTETQVPSTATPVLTDTPAPTETPRPTDTPVPTETPTPVPLGEIDLLNLITGEIGLPSYLEYPTSGSTSRLLTGVIYLPGASRASNIASFQLRRAGTPDNVGGVNVLWFERPADASRLYADASGKLQSELGRFGRSVQYTDLGQNSLAVSEVNQFHVVFRRCDTVAHLWAVRAHVNESDILQYAVSLDELIQEMICDR